MDKLKKIMNTRMITKILSIITLITSLVFMYLLKRLNILPNRYFFLIVGVLTIIEALFLMFAFNKKLKKWVLIVLDVLCAIVLIIECFGAYKLNQTYHFINIGIRMEETRDYYYIVVNKDSEYTKVNDIESKVIYYCSDIENIDEIKQVVTNRVHAIMDNVDNYSDLLEMIDTDKTKIILVNEATYEAINEVDEESSTEELTEKVEKYRIIDTIEIVKKIEHEETRDDITTSHLLYI